MYFNEDAVYEAQFQDKYTWLDDISIFTQLDLDCFKDDYQPFDIEEEYTEDDCIVCTATCPDNIKVTLWIYNEEGDIEI